MVTSLRSFILQLMKVSGAPMRCADLEEQIVNRYTSSLTYNTVVLFLSHLLGMYCLSSVLLLRMSLPEKYRYADGIAPYSRRLKFSAQQLHRCSATSSFTFTTVGLTVRSCCECAYCPCLCERRHLPSEQLSYTFVFLRATQNLA